MWWWWWLLLLLFLLLHHLVDPLQLLLLRESIPLSLGVRSHLLHSVLREQGGLASDLELRLWWCRCELWWWCRCARAKLFVHGVHRVATGGAFGRGESEKFLELASFRYLGFASRFQTFEAHFLVHLFRVVKNLLTCRHDASRHIIWIVTLDLIIF